jgi:CspA family cold shock protein
VAAEVDVEVFPVTTGKVLRFDEVRGYGFIAPDDGGEDVFVHANDLRDNKHLFRPGIKVAFEVEDGDRGLKAADVRLADGAPTARGLTRSAHRDAGPRDEDDDALCDVLSHREFRHEVTEVLLQGAPTLTASQIVQVRQRLVELAQAHNWVES